VLESLLRALLVIPEIWRRDLLLQFGQFRRLALDVKETSAVLRPVVSALQIQRADPARQSRQASFFRSFFGGLAGSAASSSHPATFDDQQKGRIA
jgi:hypothetical protein